MKRLIATCMLATAVLACGGAGTGTAQPAPSSAAPPAARPAAPPAAQPAEPELVIFTPIFGAIPGAPPVGVKRRALVELNANALGSVKIGAKVTLQLFSASDSGGAVTLSYRVNRRVESRFALDVWQGRGEELLTELSIVRDAKGVTVRARASDNRYFEVQQLQDGRYVVSEFDLRQQGECGITPNERLRFALFNTSRDNGSKVDLLLLYSLDLAGDPGLGRFAADAEVSLNDIMTNSGISMQIQVTSISPVQYHQSASSMTQDLTWVSTDPTVAALRTAQKADLVNLLVLTGGPYGQAFEMDTLSSTFESKAFSVVRYAAALGIYSLAHEIGHNFGAGHQASNGGPGRDPFSVGFELIQQSPTLHTVMASVDETRIAYFSNPTKSFRGESTGAPNADNAKTINDSRVIVSGFR